MAESSAITYEGIDHSEHDAQFRRDFSLPGDRLRINPDARITGVDMKEVEAAVGTGVLTVSKTVMTGQHEEDIVGGSRTTVIPQYEFEGVEGRFSAKAFQHELGEFPMSGVLAINAQDPGRLWLVPMGADGEGNLDRVTGPARELTGFTGKHQDDLHPDGIDGLKVDVAFSERQALIGDFYVRSATTFEDRTGPVDLVGSPWSANASDKEAALAERAVMEAIFEKRISEVARDSEAILKTGGMHHEDGRERSETTELVDALDARRREPTPQNSGRVLDAAEAMLGMLDDRGTSNTRQFDALSTSVEAAGHAGDALLRIRNSDLGLEPAAVRQMEALAKDHDEAMDAGKTSAPGQAARGAAMAAQAGRGI